MSFSSSRRTMLVALCTLPLAPLAKLSTCLAAPTPTPIHNTASILQKLEHLEKASGGHLGLCLLSSGNGSQMNYHVQYRAEERFPLCSTVKLMLAAAILHKDMTDTGLLQRSINIQPQDIVPHSPIVEKYTHKSLTVSALCAASLQYSDNAAANLLLRLIDGPEGLTRFARFIGDSTFRLDRSEPELNECSPGDPRDTTSPAAMAASLYRLALGNILAAPQRALLQDWLRGNTTGNQRIRAGLPPNWQVGDKTGSGNYGTTNDIAVLWPPHQPPLVLTIYFTQAQKNAPLRSDVLAEASRIVCGVPFGWQQRN